MKAKLFTPLVRLVRGVQQSGLRTFGKFCVVGGSGVVVDMGILALLVHVGTLPLPLAKAVACETAIVNNFLWNDRWTFRKAGSALSGCARFLRFNGVSLAGLALNVALFSAQVLWLGMNVYLANAAAIVMVAGFNYTLSRRWAWERAEASSPSTCHAPPSSSNSP